VFEDFPFMLSLVEAFLAFSNRILSCNYQAAEQFFCRLLKKTQRRAKIEGGGVLLYVDAKSVERNEAYEAF